MSDAVDSLLKVQDVAAILNVSTRTVERMVVRKVLRCVAIGHSTKRYRRADVERAMAVLAGDVQPGAWL